MNNLIVAVIAIAIVAVLALAAIFYGGSIWQSSGERAKYAGYMNYGAQIEGSMKMHLAKGGFFPQGETLEETSGLILQQLLNDEYLTTIPPGDWFIDASAIYKPLEDFEECRRMNAYFKKDVENPASIDGCPECGDVNFSDWPGCRRTALGAE